MTLFARLLPALLLCSVACLAADGKLAPGAQWRQESVIGSAFVGSYETLADGKIRPSITGTAYVQSEAVFHFHPQDPFAWSSKSCT